MDYIGWRRRWRDVAGLTQQQLGERVGGSGAYVSMIENGERALTKRSRLIAFASALGVSITDLTAQPLPPRSPEEYAIYRIAPALRAALDEQLADDDQTWPLERWRSQLAIAMTVRMACDYTSLAATLPELVRQTRHLADTDSMEGYTYSAEPPGPQR
ncbi:MAG TPA: helix-turn-helix transcriptional regulator [Candidatus Limnocylindrales bacterium]